MGLMIGIPLLMLGFCNIVTKKNIDYLTVFCMLWGSINFFVFFSLFGMKEFSDSIYTILFTGIYTYILAFFLGKYGIKKSITFRIGEKKRRLYDFELNYKLIYIFEVILTIFVVYTALRTIGLLRNGLPMGKIHAMYLKRGDAVFFTSSFMNELHSKFVIPYLYCVCALTVYLLVFDRKKSWKIIILNIFNVLLWVIATGGRLILGYLIIDLFLALALSGYKLSNRVYKKIKKIVSLIIFILGIAIVVYTIFRKGFSISDSGILDVVEEFYDYLTLCVPLSAHWISDIDSSGMQTYGTLTLYGVLSNINWITARLGHELHFLETATKFLSDIEIMIPIFENASCNAFVTCFAFFYADFRMFGVVIGSLLFGWVSGRIDRTVHIKIDAKTVIIYLLFSQCIIKSFVRFELSNASVVLAFIYVLLIVKKKKK